MKSLPTVIERAKDLARGCFVENLHELKGHLCIYRENLHLTCECLTCLISMMHRSMTDSNAPTPATPRTKDALDMSCGCNLNAVMGFKCNRHPDAQLRLFMKKVSRLISPAHNA